MGSLSKKAKIILGIIGGVIIILGLLWYYQNQGFIKIFPTSQDREIKRLLEIDETKFSSPEGLTEEQYQEIMDRLVQARQKVFDDPENAQLWFLFGSDLEFFNDHEGAVSVWKKTLELQPQNFVAAHNIANNYQYFLKDFLEAERYYRLALWAKPDNTPSYQGLMDLYRYNLTSKKGEYESLILEAVKNDPANEAGYYSELVGFLVAENQIEKARQYFTELELLAPENAGRLKDKYKELN